MHPLSNWEKKKTLLNAEESFFLWLNTINGLKLFLENFDWLIYQEYGLWLGVYAKWLLLKLPKVILAK